MTNNFFKMQFYESKKNIIKIITIKNYLIQSNFIKFIYIYFYFSKSQSGLAPMIYDFFEN